MGDYEDFAMDLMYYKTERGNFGDDLNTWLWDFLLPNWRSWDSSVILFGVGTLLNEERLGQFRDRSLLIVGSGVGYGQRPIEFPLPASWDIRCVRGPRSAEALGLPAEKGLIDPAVMVTDMEMFHDVPQSDVPIFIPHHNSIQRHDWQAACGKAGIRYVSPERDAREVIKEIAAAPLVLTESMHGAILADAFRVPWLPVRINQRFNAAKWQDWAESLGLTVTVQPLLPSIETLSHRLALPRLRGVQSRLRVLSERPVLVSGLRRLLNMPSMLSEDSILQQRKKDFSAVIDRIKRDYG